MGWNIHTWLWATVALCALGALYFWTAIGIYYRQTPIDEPIKFKVEMRNDQVERAGQALKFCGYLATYCILTVVIMQTFN
jgi:hypothetical protein